jgi:hypothetical protein
MEPAAHVLVVGGIIAIAFGCIIPPIVVRLDRLQTPSERERTEDGHARAAQREERWYALDEPMLIDRSSFEKH